MAYSTKRSVREAEMRNERVYFKFIHDYVKNVESDLYRQASNLHKTIRELYSSRVKDLTKTSEFMAETRPGVHIPRHFYRKDKISNPSNNNSEREMVLKIHLLPQGETAPTPTTTTPVVAPPPTQCPTDVMPLPPTDQHMYEEQGETAPTPTTTTPVVAPPPTQCPTDVMPLPPTDQHVYEEQGETAPVPTTTTPVVAPPPTQCPTDVMPLPPTDQHMYEEQGETAPVPTTTTPVVAPPPTQCPMDVMPLPPMNQHVYEELLNDLQSDPLLYQILNDFPDDFMGDVDMQGPTPLEQELQQNL